MVVGLTITSCDYTPQQQKSDSGVKKASTHVKTDMNGNTVEQKNITKRLERDNQIGSIKHLYVISSYTGDVLQYSTVQGKVTSGGKRLSPKTVNGTGMNTAGYPNYVTIGETQYSTDEVLDDGGAYGDSGNYLFWFDAQDNYHQYYPSGGTYLEICDKPLRVKKTNSSVTLEK
jgi:hypothetical protein